MKDLKCISIKHFQHVYNVRTYLEQTLHEKISKIIIIWTNVLLSFCSNKLLCSLSDQIRTQRPCIWYKRFIKPLTTYDVGDWSWRRFMFLATLTCWCSIFHILKKSPTKLLKKSPTKHKLANKALSRIRFDIQSTQGKCRQYNAAIIILFYAP